MISPTVRPVDLFAASGAPANRTRASGGDGLIPASVQSYVRSSVATKAQPGFCALGEVPAKSTSLSYHTEWPHKGTTQRYAPSNGRARAQLAEAHLQQQLCHLQRDAGVPSSIGASNQWLTKGRGGGCQDPSMRPELGEMRSRSTWPHRSPSPHRIGEAPLWKEPAFQQHDAVDISARAIGTYSPARLGWTGNVDGAAARPAPVIERFPERGVNHTVTQDKNHSFSEWQHFNVNDISSSQKLGTGMFSPVAGGSPRKGASISALHHGIAGHSASTSAFIYQEMPLKTSNAHLQKGGPASCRSNSSERVLPNKVPSGSASPPTSNVNSCPIGAPPTVARTKIAIVTRHSTGFHSLGKGPTAGEILTSLRACPGVNPLLAVLDGRSAAPIRQGAASFSRRGIVPDSPKPSISSLNFAKLSADNPPSSQRIHCSQSQTSRTAVTSTTALTARSQACTTDEDESERFVLPGGFDTPGVPAGVAAGVGAVEEVAKAGIGRGDRVLVGDSRPGVVTYGPDRFGDIKVLFFDGSSSCDLKISQLRKLDTVDTLGTSIATALKNSSSAPNLTSLKRTWSIDPSVASSRAPSDFIESCRMSLDMRGHSASDASTGTPEMGFRSCFSMTSSASVKTMTPQLSAASFSTLEVAQAADSSGPSRSFSVVASC